MARVNSRCFNSAPSIGRIRATLQWGANADKTSAEERAELGGSAGRAEEQLGRLCTEAVEPSTKRDGGASRRSDGRERQCAVEGRSRASVCGERGGIMGSGTVQQAGGIDRSPECLENRSNRD